MRSFALVLLVAACGAAPDRPMLANVPRPNTAAVAGTAAAAAAAITLASPDTATVKPEKNSDEDKKPVEVKENVPGPVLDRLDKTEPERPTSAKEPAGSKRAEKPPKDALDFSSQP